ncbi:hypothetical protein, partial [Vibrio splendidus]|uniref:hypothetical protein n=1 Tax=Vibrio splendidus TaxID=29497 RepID=UPI001F53598F
LSLDVKKPPCKVAFSGYLKRISSLVKSFHDSHIVKALQVSLYFVWIQDVLDRATRIIHQSREVPKVEGKGTNQNYASAR